MNAATPLEGQVALVTGAGQGVGRGIALAMSAAGARVAVVDLNPDTAQAVAAEIGDGAIAIQTDVSDREQVNAAVASTVEQLGGLDILVNNAQNLRDLQHTFLDTDEEHLRRNLHSGLFGTYYFLQAAHPHLKKRPGAVIDIGSAAGVTGMEMHFSYAATKEAIRATTRVVAREWGPDGIRANIICPAAYDSPALSGYMDRMGPEHREAMLAGIPLRKLGTSADIGAVAVFLASDAAGYVTGQTIMVDGGSNMDAGR